MKWTHKLFSPSGEIVLEISKAEYAIDSTRMSKIEIKDLKVYPYPHKKKKHAQDIRHFK